MPIEYEDAEQQLWTIGHWNSTEAEFLRPLHAWGIELLVDVRAFPGSRRSPQFGKDVMPGWLEAAGIEYVHIPELGGRRGRQAVDPLLNAGWRSPSFKNYADYTLSSSYEGGITQLTELAQDARTTIMCSEPVPWRCHRLLISNTLTARGWDVWHLIGDAQPLKHVLSAWGAAALIHEDGQITYPPTAP